MDIGVTAAQSSAARRAAVFQRIRDAHQTEVAEDYVELIEDLIAETGEARLVDLAENMGVTHATAAKVVQRLQRDDLVQSRPYRSIFLSDKGRIMAAMARRRHRIVLALLHAIGVTEATAEADSEGIEHHVSEETLAAFERITAKLEAERQD